MPDADEMPVVSNYSMGVPRVPGDADDCPIQSLVDIEDIVAMEMGCVFGRWFVFITMRHLNPITVRREEFEERVAPRLTKEWRRAWGVLVRQAKLQEALNAQS